VLILHDPKQILAGEVLEQEAHTVVISKSLIQLHYEIQLFTRSMLYQKIENCFFIFDVFNSLGSVNTEFINTLQRSQFFFFANIHNNEIDRSVLALAYFNLGVKVKYLLFWFRGSSFLIFCIFCIFFVFI